MQLKDRFPDNESAEKWLEEQRWGESIRCPKCNSDNVKFNKGKSRKEPYRCGDCRAFYSVRTDTILHKSKVSLREWVFAMYFISTSLKGVSSMKLHKDLGRTQKTAWLLAQKIREGFSNDSVMLGGEIKGIYYS